MSNIIIEALRRGQIAGSFVTCRVRGQFAFVENLLEQWEYRMPREFGLGFLDKRFFYLKRNDENPADCRNKQSMHLWLISVGDQGAHGTLQDAVIIFRFWRQMMRDYGVCFCRVRSLSLSGLFLQYWLLDKNLKILYNLWKIFYE